MQSTRRNRTDAVGTLIKLHDAIPRTRLRFSLSVLIYATSLRWCGRMSRYSYRAVEDGREKLSRVSEQVLPARPPRRPGISLTGGSIHCQDALLLLQ